MNGRSWHFSAASFVMDNMTACFERLITASKIAQQYVLETCESQGLVYIFGERFLRQKVALDASERNFKVPLKAKRIHCTAWHMENEYKCGNDRLYYHHHSYVYRMRLHCKGVLDRLVKILNLCVFVWVVFFLIFCLMLHFQQCHILILKGEEFMCLICMWCDCFLFLQQYINHTEFFQVYWMPLKLSIQNYTFSFIFFLFIILQYAKFSLVNTLWVFCKMRGMIGSQIPDLNCYFSLSPPRIRSTYL